MKHKPAFAPSFRNAIVATATSAVIFALGVGDPTHAETEKGPFNCAMGPTVLPDDRWSSCATVSVEYCGVGPTAVPDDRWEHCPPK